MLVPICRFRLRTRVPWPDFARAPFCRRFRDEARYGKDHADRQTFYGFRLHARLTWPGLVSEATPGTGQEFKRRFPRPPAHICDFGADLI